LILFFWRSLPFVKFGLYSKFKGADGSRWTTGPVHYSRFFVSVRQHHKCSRDISPPLSVSECAADSGSSGIDVWLCMVRDVKERRCGRDSELEARGKGRFKLGLDFDFHGVALVLSPPSERAVTTLSKATTTEPGIASNTKYTA
jgi:hypothetical protein